MTNQHDTVVDRIARLITYIATGYIALRAVVFAVQ